MAVVATQVRASDEQESPQEPARPGQGGGAVEGSSEEANQPSDESESEDAAAEASDKDVEISSIRRRITNANDVLQELRTSASDRNGLFERGPIALAFPPWQDFNSKLDDEIGLRLGFSYYMLYQWASSSPFGPGQAGAGDLDFFGRWNLLRGEDGALGILGFNLEHRHAYEEIPPFQVDSSIGSIWPTTRGFTDTGFNFNELWWDQQFSNDRISFRIGTINQKHFHDLHRFKSQKRFFLSFPLSDSPTIAFPPNGFGGVLRVSPREDFHIVAGVGDANGERSVGSIDTFFRNTEFFSALDLSFAPTIDGLGDGRYSITFWHTDASSIYNRPSGRGFNALAEQEVADGVVPFVRYGYGDGADLAVEHTAAIGVGFERPFGAQDDVAGIGASWSRPSDLSLRDQWGFEAFYRFQLTTVIQLTPGFQVIVDPSLNTTEDVIGIFQLRVGLIF